jgi:hypothetical protein
MSSNTPNDSQRHDEEITLRDIYVGLRQFLSFALRRRAFLLFVILPVLAYFIYQTMNAHREYKAELTYTINDSGGSPNLVSGILGTMGLSKGGKINLDKLIDISRSRQIMQKVLFSKVKADTFDQKDDYLINHLINLYRWDEKWAKSHPALKAFNFSSPPDSSSDNYQSLALKNVWIQMVGGKGVSDPIFKNTYNDETGILTMTIVTRDEQLSISICNAVFHEINVFYNKYLSTNSKQDVEVVSQKQDSIYSLMKTKEFQLARFNDSNRNVLDPSLIGQRRILETELLKLKTMYAEVTKNFEAIDFNLQSGTPDITLIYAPVKPLDTEEKKWWIEILKGLLSGLILGLTLLWFRWKIEKE